MTAKLNQDPVLNNTEYIFLKDNFKLHQVSFSEILILTSEGNYVTVTTNSRKFVIKSSLKKIFSKFPDQFMVQIHRNIAVQLYQVQYIDLQENTVYLKDGTNLAMSRKYKSDLTRTLLIA